MDEYKKLLDKWLYGTEEPVATGKIEDFQKLFNIIKESHPSSIGSFNTTKSKGIKNNGNTKAYLTKLLLAECNCTNCVYKNDEKVKDHCEKFAVGPEKNICKDYSEKQIIGEYAITKPNNSIYYLNYL